MHPVMRRARHRLPDGRPTIDFTWSGNQADMISTMAR